MRAPERNLTSFEGRRGAQRLPPPEYVYVEPSDLPGTLRKLWRRKATVLTVALAGLAIAAIAGVVMEDRYGATSVVRVGVPQPQIADLQSVNALAPNPETMETEAAAAQSRTIATEAVKRLGLEKDPEFNPALRAPSLWAKIVHQTWGLITLQFLRPARPAPQPKEADAGDRYDPQQNVVAALLSRLDVSQEGRSHMLQIEVQSESPFKAARIANAVANLYVESRLESRAHENSSTGKWLDQQIATLRARVDTAERAVEDYRRKEGLYQTKQAGVTEQQLGELNTQLILAQTEMASAKAKLSDASILLRGKTRSLDSVPAVLSSPTIIALKQQEAEVERHAAELSSTYGKKHPEVQNVLAEKTDIQRKIRVEVQRIVQGLRNEANTAEARYNALRQKSRPAQGPDGPERNTKSVKLHELEREADASRNLYQNFLLRYQETQAQQNFIGADSRVVSLAVPPLSPAYPPRKLMLVLGGLAGLALGAFLALLGEADGPFVRTADEVEEETQLPMLAMVPRMGSGRRVRHAVLNDPTRRSARRCESCTAHWCSTGPKGCPRRSSCSPRPCRAKGSRAFASRWPACSHSTVPASSCSTATGIARTSTACSIHPTGTGCPTRCGASSAAWKPIPTTHCRRSPMSTRVRARMPSSRVTRSRPSAAPSGFDRLRDVVERLSQQYRPCVDRRPTGSRRDRGAVPVACRERFGVLIRWGRTSREEVISALRAAARGAGGDCRGCSVAGKSAALPPVWSWSAQLPLCPNRVRGLARWPGQTGPWSSRSITRRSRSARHRSAPTLRPASPRTEAR